MLEAGSARYAAAGTAGLASSAHTTRAFFAAIAMHAR